MTTHEDTRYAHPFRDYLKVLASEGFVEAAKVHFKNFRGGEETFFLFFNKEAGILLSFDTFDMVINSGEFIYNWKPRAMDESYQYTDSSGHFTKDVWVGRQDARINLRARLANLRKNGTFVTPWIEQPPLILLHSADRRQKAYNINAIAKERIALLPSDVRRAITPHA